MSFSVWFCGALISYLLLVGVTDFKQCKTGQDQIAWTITMLIVSVIWPLSAAAIVCILLFTVIGWFFNGITFGDKDE